MVKTRQFREKEYRSRKINRHNRKIYSKKNRKRRVNPRKHKSRRLSGVVNDSDGTDEIKRAIEMEQAKDYVSALQLYTNGISSIAKVIMDYSVRIETTHNFDKKIILSNYIKRLSEIVFESCKNQQLVIKELEMVGKEHHVLDHDFEERQQLKNLIGLSEGEYQGIQRILRRADNEPDFDRDTGAPTNLMAAQRKIRQKKEAEKKMKDDALDDALIDEFDAG